MISIITAIHNQLPVNKLFYKSVCDTAEGEFELIIIDNNSTDGSAEFFESKPNVILIKNIENYSYPHCQNQGIDVAQYDYLAFFNNDIILPLKWDTRAIKIMQKKEIEVASYASNDHLDDAKVHRRLVRKYKRIKYSLQFLFGVKEWSLQLMVWFTYGNFHKFTEKRYNTLDDKTVEAYSGSCVLMHKNAFAKVGKWDNRIMAADHDLFNRTKKRSITHGDIKPMQLLAGLFVHHFTRLTLKSNYAPFADKSNHIALQQKWGDETTILQKDIVAKRK